MEKELNPYNTIFALDIGTNSVVGVLGISEEEGLTITHSVVKFHKNRAMVDGQIHDIPRVLKIVNGVKEHLEQEVGFSLKQVSIAAAGRALRTLKISQSIPLNQSMEITRDQIKVLEFEGLNKAYEQMNCEEANQTKYFCVGHSLTKFMLDEMEISNPMGQKGKTLTGNIIATFLPETVVDSLHTVMSKAGLEVDYMTLEPIAALDVIVPENIRLLNIALVDIGAGTSDIAITKEGTVVGYGMTAVAGDEITEDIAKAFLLGFDQAEMLKCRLSREENHVVSNILGESINLTTKEVLENIQGSINLVSEKIAEAILEINGKTTSAVFLVGGGSQIPGILKGIAHYLQIPANRVVMKTMDDIEGIVINTGDLSGPEAITPLGIFNKSIKDQCEDFIEISVNKKSYKMFQRKNLKIGDALALAKVNPRAFIPQGINEVLITVDNEKKRIPSPRDQRVKIYLNGKIAGIDAAIKNGDQINLEDHYTLGERKYPLKTLLPAKWHENYLFYVNDQKKALDSLVNDNDKIVLFKKKNYSMDEKKSTKEDPLANDHQVNRKESNHKKEIPPKKREAEKSTNKLEMKHKNLSIYVNENQVEIPSKNPTVIFTDIFDYIDFDRKKAKGRLVMTLNGRRASFTDALQEGDHIEVYWK